MTSFRIDTIAVDGFGPLQAAHLDLRDLKGIIAIAGSNGSGKSTLLESILGAMYRETPSRGKLANLAALKGSTLELQAHNGSPILARHVVDATGRQVRQEAILRVGGDPPTSGKVKDFDALAKTVFPPEEVFLASVFSAQGGMGNFADLSRDERRQVLQRLLGLERLQLIADACKDHRKDVETRIVVLRGRIEDLQGQDLEQLLEQRRTALQEQVAYEAQVEELRPQLEQARTTVARAEAAHRDVEKAHEAWQEQKRRIARLSLQQKEAEEDVKKAEEARVLLPDLKLELATGQQVQKEIEEIKPRLSSMQTEIAQKRERYNENHKNLVEAEESLEKDESILARAEEIRAAVEEVKAIQGKLSEAEEEVESLEREVERNRGRAEAHGAALATQGRLAERLADLERAAENLEGVPCGGEGEFSACRFLADAARARDSIVEVRNQMDVAALDLDPEASTDLDTSIGRFRAAKERRGSASTALEAARASAADLPLLEDAEPRATKSRERIDAFRELENTFLMTGKALKGEVAKLELEKKKLEARLATHHPGGLEQTQTHVAKVEAEAEALEARQERHGAIGEDLQRETTSLGEEPSETAALDSLLQARAGLADLEEDEKRLAGGVTEAGRKIAALDEQVKQAEAAEEKRQGYQADIDRLLQEQADWKLLEKAFGKDGIQALMIDAAGPAISTLCNELLQVTFGTRFRVSLETTKLDSTGKRTLETLDLRVIDSERGREGTIDTLSGGEKVVVGLALRLALILHNNQGGTQLFADEMDGALDGENAQRFVPLLRRAMELGGLEQVVFVSHRSECQAAADHVVEVKDGGVEVRA